MPQQRKTVRKKAAPEELVPPEELENARWGYQAAITSSFSYASTFWSIFNAMLVANSIVLAGIGLSSSSKFLSVIGWVLCLVWVLLGARHQAYVTYYLLSAREIEERYFLKSVKTFSRGADFALGKAVSLEMGKLPTQQQMGLWARWGSGKVGYIVVGIFFLIYTVTFFIPDLL